ncbi:MAG: hypothetical protein IRY94_15025 [Rhodospirillaceae bacterium]|nr:hypothetical protein [Rhodospirillaceae bacterium]
MTIGRTLDQVIADLPAMRRRRIEARYQTPRQVVKDVAALRKRAGKVQAEVASALDIKQPPVSAIADE